MVASVAHVIFICAMRIALFSIVAAFILLNTQSAKANDLSTGAGFLALCEKMGSEWEDVRCLDYLGGIFEGLIVGIYVAQGDIAQHFCITPDTDNQKRLTYFIGFLKRDTWRHESPTPNLFYLALKEQYPCKKDR